MKKLIPIIFCAFALFFACKKADSVLGLDVQPENDLLYGSFSDTSRIKVKTVLDDSLYSSLNNLGYYLLGSYEDPTFGRTDASLYASFILKDNITNVNTGSKPQMDSVVLSLAYVTDFYGDTMDPLKVNVHMLHLGTPLSKDSLYHSYDSYHYYEDDITESGNGQLFYPRPASKQVVDTAHEPPQLRIRLNKTWFEEYLLLHDDVNLVNSGTLQNIFKGLYITTKNSTVYSPDYGSILYFSLYNNYTKITFYYHNFESPKQTLDFTCGGGAAHLDHFDHDYGTANFDLKNQLMIPVGDTNDHHNHHAYLQAMAGLGLKVEIPNLKHYCDSGAIAVNRADLVIKIDQDPQWLGTQYSPPLGLWMTAYDSTGKSGAQVYDAGTYWFGGAYDAVNKQYVFNIARHINKICNGTIKNYGFFVYTAQSCSKPQRVVVGGAYDAGPTAINNIYHMQLRLSYTKLYKQ